MQLQPSVNISLLRSQGKRLASDVLGLMRHDTIRNLIIMSLQQKILSKLLMKRLKGFVGAFYSARREHRLDSTVKQVIYDAILYQAVKPLVG